MQTSTSIFRKTGTADTINRPSPELWANCPWDQIRSGEIAGLAFHDDFDSMPLVGTQTTQIAYDKYKVFATSGASVLPLSAVNSVDLGHGILGFTNAASNDSASLAQSYPAYKITGLKTTSGPLWFEARIALTSLLTLREGFFLGLGETNLFTLATAVPFNADAAVPTNGGSLIGFNKWEIVSSTAASTTSLVGGVNTSYTDRATSFSQIQADAAIFSAAFTFMKLGFYYDPYASDTTRMVRFFADNVELTSAMTKTQITNTTNLKANSLGLMFATVAGASVSTDITFLDWWRVAQLVA